MGDVPVPLDSGAAALPATSGDGRGCRHCGLSEEVDECGGKEVRGVLLLCDGCDGEFHFTCLSPPLTELPSGDWFCRECVAAGRGGGYEDLLSLQREPLSGAGAAAAAATAAAAAAGTALAGKAQHRKSVAAKQQALAAAAGGAGVAATAPAAGAPATAAAAAAAPLIASKGGLHHKRGGGRGGRGGRGGGRGGLRALGAGGGAGSGSGSGPAYPPAAQMDLTLASVALLDKCALRSMAVGCRLVQEEVFEKASALASSSSSSRGGGKGRESAVLLRSPGKVWEESAAPARVDKGDETEDEVPHSSGPPLSVKIHLVNKRLKRPTEALPGATRATVPLLPPPLQRSRL